MIEKAIKLAMEEGWRPTFLSLRHLHNISNREIFLEPDFWQALGKSLGWEDCKCEQCGTTYPEYVNGCVCCGKSVKADPNMLYHAETWLDTHFQGQETENKFWEDLLKENV